MRFRRRLDLDENPLLERKVFRRGFEHEVGVGDGVGQIFAQLDRLDQREVVADGDEVFANARQRRLPRALHRVEQRDAMPRHSEHLCDAGAHQAGADNGDGGFLAQNAHPAV